MKVSTLWMCVVDDLLSGLVKLLCSSCCSCCCCKLCSTALQLRLLLTLTLYGAQGAISCSVWVLELTVYAGTPWAAS